MNKYLHTVASGWILLTLLGHVSTCDSHNQADLRTVFHFTGFILFCFIL